MQYIARQPILNTERHLTAYELLFRDSGENSCRAGDPDLVSKQTIDTAVLMGLDTLSGGNSIYLNCAHDLIVDGFPTLFPPDLTVVEILESVRPSTELVEACKNLKRSGYRIALDDFVPQPGYAPLIELADIIKVDFRATPPEQWPDFAKNFLTPKRQLLAEKVETEQEFHTAVELGFSLFQGYLFSKPKVLSTASIDGLDANQFRILRIMSKPYLDFIEVETLIKSEPALCYRLLRFLNSPAFYLQSEIRSILHALVLLGESETRKWLLLVCAVMGAKTTKSHLLATALVRARFAELMAPQLRLSGSALFILGLLSLMDAILDVPMAIIADQVAVSNEVRSALNGAPSPMRQCLELVLAYEAAGWNRCEEIRKNGCIPAQDLSKAYLEAVRWAKQVTEN